MTLTLESLKEAMRASEENRVPQHAPFYLSPGSLTLLGMNIIEAPERFEPVLQLREDAPVTDAFRAEFDAYLLDLFGSRDVSLIPKGQAYMFQDRVIMRRADVVALSGLVS